MLNKLNFLLILLLTYKKKHLSIFLLSSLLISIVSSVVFISSSIKHDIFHTLESQADFTIQKYKAGKVLNTPTKWIDEFLQIDGITNVQGRIYGTHFYEPAEEYFTIIGIDLFDTQVVSSLNKLIDDINTTQFLSRQNMIIGSDVKKFLDEYHYFDYYNFRPPDRSIEKVFIYDTLNKHSNIVSGDTILMDISLARKILGVEDGYVTDIILTTPNPQEIDTVKIKLRISHFDMRLIQKEEIKKYYQNLYNYKGGIFLVLYIIVILSFLLILYQRYSIISNSDAKEVAILRQLGWQIKEVIWFKILENIFVILSAYILGVSLAYFYVYFLNAPILKNIFLGYSNLDIQTIFSPAISFTELFLIFIFFTVPFIATITIPVWRLSTKEPSEIIK